MTAVIEDPEADVARAHAAISLVANRLLEAQVEAAELRRAVAEAASLAEIDPCLQSELFAVRARLAAAESRVVELTAAEQVGRDMVAAAKRRALEASKDTDWQACADLLRDAAITAAALDSLLQQAGSLCAQIRQQLAQVATVIGPHLVRADYNIPLPDLNTIVLAQLDRAGGPPFDPRRRLVAAASVAEAVAGHTARVLRHRPALEEEPSHE